MSDNEFDGFFEKFKDEYQPTFVKKLEENKIRPESEIKGMLAVAKPFLAEQMKLPLEDRAFFMDDEFGYQITFFKIDDEGIGTPPWNGPQATDDPLEAKLSIVFPLKEDRMDIKLAHTFFKNNGGKLMWGNKVIGRGNGWIKYCPLEDVPLKGYNYDPEGIDGKGYFFEKEFMKVMRILDKVAYKKLSDVPKVHYNRYPGFRMFQLLEVR